MLHHHSLSVVVGLAVLLGAAAASAQAPITEADRPGFADPPTIIPRDAIQLESGVQLERESGGDAPDTGTLTLPDLLLRVGILERLELRLEAEGLLYEFREGESDRALGSDLVASTKVGLWEQRRWLPETGVLFSLSFPVGSEAATSGGVDPELAGLYQWTLGKQTALVLNTVFGAPSLGNDDDRRIFQFDPRLSLDRQVTLEFGAFIEYYGEIKTGGEADEHSLDAGITWLLVRHRLQLDVSGGGGLNEAAPDWFISAGLSLRFNSPWSK